MKLQNLIHILIGIVCIGLLPTAHAVSPPPDGAYPGGNTAEGQKALFSLTTGGFNTAVGWFSLFSATTGSFNTGVGAGALVLNTADQNTATGAGALFGNTTGDRNTANGAFALFSNSIGFFNTAVGAGALLNSTTAYHNTAIGTSALTSDTDGTYNTALGSYALETNTSGSANVAVGPQALDLNTTGSQNVAVGGSALLGSTGSRNIGIGSAAGESLTTGDDNIDIGNRVSAVAGESGIIRIGTEATQTATFIAGISGTAVTGVAVLVDVNGQLGVAPSSERLKDAIKPIDKVSEAILALNPVTFHYKADKTKTPQFGLIAEEVAKVNPNLVVRDKRGKIYTVRYDAVNAMLLNEFLKEHEKTEKLEATVASLIVTVKEQAAQIQKVSAQLEASKPERQVVNNP